ncbi:MAG: hypothetical protein GXO54_00965 [Chloroflexi bacterium]|nr:hypothetical protein [Chloroflexota bacterium]
MSKLDPFLEHLRFLGYEVQPDEQYVRAYHPTRWNLLVREFRGGVLFTTFLGGSAYAKQHPEAYLALINALNRGATVARFYADKDNDLVMEAYWPGPYDRESFAQFMDLWDEDTREHLVQQRDAPRFFE